MLTIIINCYQIRGQDKVRFESRNRGTFRTITLNLESNRKLEDTAKTNLNELVVLYDRCILCELEENLHIHKNAI